MNLTVPHRQKGPALSCMDYGHHDLIHSHRVYRFQAVERRLNDYGTMMGNQVMMTVIHTLSC